MGNILNTKTIDKILMLLSWYRFK